MCKQHILLNSSSFPQNSPFLQLLAHIESVCEWSAPSVQDVCNVFWVKLLCWAGEGENICCERRKGGKHVCAMCWLFSFADYLVFPWLLPFWSCDLLCHLPHAALLHLQQLLHPGGHQHGKVRPGLQNSNTSSLLRYFSILHPLTPRLTTRYTKLVVVLIWILSVIICSPDVALIRYEHNTQAGAQCFVCKYQHLHGWFNPSHVSHTGKMF